MAKKSKTKKHNYFINFIIFILLSAVLLASLTYESQINSYFGLVVSQEESTTDDTTEQVVTGEGGDLVVHFIDVGQGDSTILELPDGRYMLIDAGKTGASDEVISYIDTYLIDAKEEDEKFTTFDIMMLTHSDEDHCGGMDEVLLEYGADLFYRPNELATHEDYPDKGADDLLAGYTEKSTISYGKVIDLAYEIAETVVVSSALDDEYDSIEPEGLSEGDAGYYSIIMYAPISNSFSDCNDYSPILIVEYEGKRIALSGDAEAESEAEFVEEAQKGEGKYAIFDDNYTVDVIKMGHHGSSTSSSEDYLNTLTTPNSVSDVFLVISCGEDNSYGHPHEAVLERVASLGFSDDNILRTDLISNIVISVEYDESAGEYALYYGAVAHSVDKATVSVGDFSYTYREIVITAIVVLFILIVVLPILYGAGIISKSKKRKRR